MSEYRHMEGGGIKLLKKSHILESSLSRLKIIDNKICILNVEFSEMLIKLW